MLQYSMPELKSRTGITDIAGFRTLEVLVKDK